MKELEKTWQRTITIWWSYTWRTLLFSFGLSFIFAFLIGFVATLLNSNAAANLIGTIVGFVTGIVVSVWVFKIILNKKFKEFDIKLISTEPTNEEMQNHFKKIAENENRRF